MFLRPALFSLLTLGPPALVLSQERPPESDGQSRATIISEPPGPAQDPTEDVGLLRRPGEVILHGAPVRLRFQSPTPSVSFMLKSGTIHTETKGWWLDLGIVISKEGARIPLATRSSHRQRPRCPPRAIATTPTRSGVRRTRSSERAMGSSQPPRHSAWAGSSSAQQLHSATELTTILSATMPARRSEPSA